MPKVAGEDQSRCLTQASASAKADIKSLFERFWQKFEGLFVETHKRAEQIKRHGVEPAYGQFEPGPAS